MLMEGEIVIYHNGVCSKCKGALELLQEMGVPHRVRYYIYEPLNRDEISALLKKLGVRASELIRKGEPLYLEKYGDKELSDEECVRALLENPELMQRPIVEKGNKAIIARPPERVLEMLGRT